MGPLFIRTQSTTVVDTVTGTVVDLMSDIESDDDVVSSIVDTTVPYVPVCNIVLSSVTTDNDSNTVPYIVATSPIMISDDSVVPSCWERLCFYLRRT